MTGLICLQGGREFTPDCRDMDAEVVSLAGAGPVAVLAGAARQGSDYAGASMRARRHYEGLGAEVVVIPDPRDGVNTAVAALTADVSLLVLPGGSPASLRTVLSGRVEALVRSLHREGMAISGASAGAMVLCTRMVRPGRMSDIVDGLGLVEGLALPHWSPDASRSWPVPDDAPLWGLPECGGIVIDGPSRWTRAIGQGEPSRRIDGTWRRVPRGDATASGP